MTITHKNRVKTTVSAVASSGLGAFTISTASSGYRTFAAGDDGKSFDCLITEGTAWEVRQGCTYTHSGTSLARGTLEDSSTGSAVAFTSAAIVSVSATADRGRRWDASALEHVAGTDANTTMEANTLYVVDMSAWATADRTYTLPAVAAVGDRVGVMVSAGDASHELIITAGSGDTLNGIAGGTEWSRVFITGEVVVMRCITANATWMVEYDGRVPQSAKMRLSTSADGETALTYTRPTAAASAGAWTDDFDNANLTDTANDRIYTRRTGRFAVVAAYAPKDTPTAGSYVNIEIRVNGTTVLGGPSATGSASGINRVAATIIAQLTAGDYIDYYYRTENGALGASGAVTWACTMALEELL